MSEKAEGAPEYPLGSEEGLRLEFKSVGALKSPADIAREVVSMLNEAGGEVWIGFGEDKEGRAVVEQDIADVQAEKRKLEESLAQRVKVDTVLESDWRVEVVKRKSGKACLRIVVGSVGVRRPPAAALDQGARFFRRSGSRVRPMEWHEIRERFNEARSTVASTDGAQAVLQSWRRRIEEQKQDLLGIALFPRHSVKFELADEGLHRLLSDPSRAGNRRSGATYGWLNSEANDEPGALSIGPREQREIRLTQSGLLTFQVRLDWLRADRGNSGSRRLHGLWLLEYTVSFLRLARALFESKAEATEFLVDFVMTGAQGWSLPQYQPGSMGFQDAESPGSIWPDRRLNDYRLEQPIQVRYEELLSNPDRIAFRLVKEFYDWCKLPADRIPSAYDRETERFTLTD